MSSFCYLLLYIFSKVPDAKSWLIRDILQAQSTMSGDLSQGLTICV